MRVIQLLLSFYLLLELSVGPFLVRELASAISNKVETRTEYIIFGLIVGMAVAIFASVLFYATVILFSHFFHQKNQWKFNL